MLVIKQCYKINVSLCDELSNYDDVLFSTAVTKSLEFLLLLHDKGSTGSWVL